MSTTLVLDLASSQLGDAEHYLDGTIKAPAHYKKPEAISAYIAEKKAERLAMAAVDIDLAKITALGFAVGPDAIDVRVCRDEQDEKLLIADVAALVKDARIITYGGARFDLPLVMRRAKYLGIPFPVLSTDRYKSPHVDLMDVLSDRDPSRVRSLSFYVRRMGWSDLTKILSGAEEAQVPTSQRWDDLEKSIRHDVTATYRLAVWLGVIPQAPRAYVQLDEGPVF
jgi:DNA polymerase elongation subunit (family B)